MKLDMANIDRQDYIWRVKYHDDTNLWEHEGNGTQNYYRDIDHKKLEIYGGQFLVYSPDNFLVPVVTIEIQCGQHIIWRKRREFKLSTNVLTTTYLVGWYERIYEKGKDPRIVQSILYIYRDGTVRLGSENIKYKPYEG